MTEREEKAKAWLNRNYGIALEIQAIQRRLERMTSDLEKVTRPIKFKEVIEANNPGNSQEDKMVDYIELSEDLAGRLTYLMSLDAQTMRVIEKVESPILRTILIERYINRLNWNQIKTKLHKDGGWVFELHRQALDAILPYVPEEAKK